jgi:hypothetical protein
MLPLCIRRENTDSPLRMIILTIHVISRTILLCLLPPLRNSTLSSKDLDNTITTRTHDESSIAAPADIADPFAPHRPMRHNVLGAYPLLERPETYAGIVSRGDGFAAVFGKAERRDGGRVGEHGVGALAWGSG